MKHGVGTFQGSSQSGKIFILFCVLAALALGIIVRLPYFLNNDFVLNDGALFVQMSEAIRHNGFALASFVNYNRTPIPFAYPPLSFYGLAITTSLLHQDVLTIVRYFPLVFNLLSIALFVVFVSTLTANRLTLLLSSCVFPLIPKSYEWVIMGGGVSRSVGFFFCLLTLIQMQRLLKEPGYKNIFFTGVLIACTGMSHLEWGITTAVTCTLLSLLRCPLREGIPLLMALGLLSLFLAAPWWVTVMSRHGIAPFLAASHTSEWDTVSWDRMLNGSKAVPKILQIPIMTFIASGSLVCIFKKQWFLPLWLVAIFVTTPRHGPTAATIPLAILSSIGFAEFFLPFLHMIFQFVRSRLSFLDTCCRGIERHLPIFAWASMLLFVAGTATAAKRTSLFSPPRSALISLTQPERTAMRWIREHTPENAQFLLLSQSNSWQDDRVAEWFPLLAERKSVATAQGLEWVSGGVFQTTVKHIYQLKTMQKTDPNSLIQFVRNEYPCVDYVGFFFPDDPPGINSFLNASSFRIHYNKDGVFIFKNIKTKQCTRRLENDKSA